MKFIHAADIHLGSPFVGLTQQNRKLAQRATQAGYEAFRTMIDCALTEQVDCLLLAGDVYDSNQHSVREQLLVKEQFERLQEAAIPVFVIRGNHDFQLQQIFAYPANVHEFGAQVEEVAFTTKRGERVVVSGFSYEERWIFHSKVDEFPRRASNADYQLALYHGEIAAETDKQQAYAPFRLMELTEKQYDYWALGHIHQKAVISHHPLAVYAGNLQGRSFKEQGEKGFYLVELQEQQPAQMTFVPTNPLEWREIETTVSEELSLEALTLQLWQQLQALSEGKEWIVRICLKLATQQAMHWQQAILLQLQQWIEQRQLAIWLLDVEIDTQPFTQLLPHIPLLYDTGGQQQRFATIANSALQNPLMMKHFADLWVDAESQQLIEQQAEQVLGQWLLEEDNDY